MLTYAIGDVHGRADLLEALLSQMDLRTSSDTQIIFLGDIIDRGPHSRRALDLVVEILDSSPNSRLILGNHEEFLLRFVDQIGDSQKLLHIWMNNGGWQTLESYGIEPGTPITEARDHLLSNFQHHVTALRNARTFVETDLYYFVHAGVDPQVPLVKQDPRTTRWIRNEFLDFDEALEKIVVHGHTPTASLLPEVFNNRIALDTGAYHSNRLCAAVFQEGTEPTFLLVEGFGREFRHRRINRADCEHSL